MQTIERRKNAIEAKNLTEMTKNLNLHLETSLMITIQKITIEDKKEIKQKLIEKLSQSSAQRNVAVEIKLKNEVEAQKQYAEN